MQKYFFYFTSNVLQGVEYLISLSVNIISTNKAFFSINLQIKCHIFNNFNLQQVVNYFGKNYFAAYHNLNRRYDRRMGVSSFRVSGKNFRRNHSQSAGHEPSGVWHQFQIAGYDWMGVRGEYFIGLLYPACQHFTKFFYYFNFQLYVWFIYHRNVRMFE